MRYWQGVTKRETGRILIKIFDKLVGTYPKYLSIFFFFTCSGNQIVDKIKFKDNLN